jgi:putative membrane protein
VVSDNLYAGTVILSHGVATPDSVWSAWSWEPTVVLTLVVVAAVYARGSKALRRSHARGALNHDVMFYAGLATIFVALIAPLDAMAEALFSAHMAQHLLLVVVAPLLIVASRPGVRFALGVPAGWRRVWNKVRPHRVVLLARNPVLVWCLHAAALWIWHLPELYDAAARNELVHALEHASFFGTAVLFWNVVIDDSRRAPGHAPRILFVFTTALQSGGLGALLTFAGDVLYRAHLSTAHDWGLTALEDQQLAGALMWIPPWFVYFIAMAMLFVKWMRAVERRSIVAGPTKP